MAAVVVRSCDAATVAAAIKDGGGKAEVETLSGGKLTLTMNGNEQCRHD